MEEEFRVAFKKDKMRLEPFSSLFPGLARVKRIPESKKPNEDASAGKDLTENSREFSAPFMDLARVLNEKIRFFKKKFPPASSGV